jgi:hypothetical protein
MNINIADRMAGAFSNRLQQVATDVVSENVGKVIDAFPYATPKMADIPPESFEEISAETTPETPPPKVEPTPEPKMTEAQIKIKANNSADVWKESLNMIQVATNLGLEFMELEKGDKDLVKKWDEKIAKAEGTFLYVPPEYHEAKERLATFQQNLLTIKIDTVPTQVRDMLYEGFYHDYKKQAEKGEIKPYSKWEAIMQSVIIVLSDGFKKMVFIVITKALRKLM